ncbi:hypothetical protein C2E23DRAFT_937530 [Lenzites betulinus]|nr:hypothetical protein C2E23DRAFT_937530 [Lenzites betulinus]
MCFSSSIQRRERYGRTKAIISGNRYTLPLGSKPLDLTSQYTLDISSQHGPTGGMRRSGSSDNGHDTNHDGEGAVLVITNQGACPSTRPESPDKPYETSSKRLTALPVLAEERGKGPPLAPALSATKHPGVRHTRQGRIQMSRAAQALYCPRLRVALWTYQLDQADARTVDIVRPYWAFGTEYFDALGGRGNVGDAAPCCEVRSRLSAPHSGITLPARAKSWL